MVKGGSTLAPLVSGVKPDLDFWRGRRVLITGHTGFKGAWLCLWLSRLGAAVTGFSDGVPTVRSLFEDLDLGSVVSDRRGDVRDFNAVQAVMTEAKPEVVLHLAAQSLVRLSYEQPIQTYATNVMGTVNVLEACRHSSETSVALMVTSDKCYENREWIWGYRENDAMGGHDPYSSSKGCAELVALAYAKSYTPKDGRLRIVTARAGNVIGGGDWADDRLVPDLVRGLTGGQLVGIRNPDAIRPWQHVLEPLNGYLVLCERAWADASVAGEGWNFGPLSDGEVAVRRIADKLCSLWRRDEGWYDASQPGQPHEANLLRLDATKAQSRLGWRPGWTIDEALARSVDVYASDLKGKLLRDLLISQIADYSSKSRGTMQ